MATEPSHGAPGPARQRWSGTGSERHEQRRDAVIAAVVEISPGASSAAVGAAFDEVATNGTKAARLAEYVTARPTALRDGDASHPKAVWQLVRALQQRGVPGLILASCPRCAREVEPLFNSPDGSRMCAQCYQRAHVERCGQCHEVKPVGARAPDQTARCAACAKQARHETCSSCGRLKHVAGRMTDGTANCSTCLRDPTTWETCSSCNRLRPVNRARTDRRSPLSELLHRADRPVRPLR